MTQFSEFKVELRERHGEARTGASRVQRSGAPSEEPGLHLPFFLV